jgi:hypothetical protein
MPLEFVAYCTSARAISDTMMAMSKNDGLSDRLNLFITYSDIHPKTAVAAIATPAPMRVNIRQKKADGVGTTRDIRNPPMMDPVIGAAM